jgi:hypothetical protein
VDLILALACSVGASLLVPRAWIPSAALLAAYAAGLLWIDQSRAMCASCDYGPFAVLGMAILGLVALGTGLTFLVRASVAIARPTENGRPFGGGPGASMLAWGLFSLIPAGLAVGLTVALTRAVVDAMWLTHLAATLVAVLWVAGIGWYVPANLRGAARWLHAAQIVRMAGGAAIGASVAWSLQVAPKALAAAEQAAGGRAFCIQVPGRGAPRLARDLFDLTGFSLDARGDSIRHARLAAGDPDAQVVYHWSRRLGRFEPDAISTETIHCGTAQGITGEPGWLRRPSGH